MGLPESLERKIDEIEIKMPGMKEQLAPYKSGLGTSHSGTRPTDVQYFETPKYQITAAKWSTVSWGSSGGTQIEGRLSLYCKEKDTLDEIRKYDTENIVVQDRYHQWKDRDDLWQSSSVKILSADDECAEIAWVKRDGSIGPAYKLALR